MATDPGRWGHSMGNLAELVIPCLQAAAPASVVEVGAYAGDVTRMLLEWSRASGARIWSIDPDPQQTLVALGEEHSQLELVRTTSLEALPELATADAYVIDGDHNYFTVSEELRLIAASAAETMPLLLCHDVGWPHARRDSYYAPAVIPDGHRQPTFESGYVFPGISGLHDGGLIYHWPAVEEGGPRNGVLTAIEDFLQDREELRFALVPAFFGLGVIWSRGAPYADALDAILDPWDRNPLVARLEANRVLHLATWQREAARAAWCQERSARKDALLRKLLESGTFALAVALSQLRQRGKPAFSKDEIRGLLPK
ncbi:MAG: class I SAM-dependent methyltransferase [Solirubrobacteraceae bacterium]